MGLALPDHYQNYPDQFNPTDVIATEVRTAALDHSQKHPHSALSVLFASVEPLAPAEVAEQIKAEVRPTHATLEVLASAALALAVTDDRVGKYILPDSFARLSLERISTIRLPLIREESETPEITAIRRDALERIEMAHAHVERDQRPKFVFDAVEDRLRAYATETYRAPTGYIGSSNPKPSRRSLGLRRG